MVPQDVKTMAEEKIFGDLKVCMIEESLIIIKLDLIMIKLNIDRNLTQFII